MFSLRWRFVYPVAQTECECRSARRDIADALFEEPVEEDLLVDRPGGKGDAAVLQRFDEAARDEYLIHVDRRDAVFAADFRDDLGGGQLEIRNVAVVQVEVGDVLLDVEVDLGAVVQLGCAAKMLTSTEPEKMRRPAMPHSAAERRDSRFKAAFLEVAVDAHAGLCGGEGKHLAQCRRGMVGGIVAERERSVRKAAHIDLEGVGCGRNGVPNTGKRVVRRAVRAGMRSDQSFI